MRLISVGEEETHKTLHDKTNNLVFQFSEDSDQPGHWPSLISLLYFMRKAKALITETSPYKSDPRFPHGGYLGSGSN